VSRSVSSPRVVLAVGAVIGALSLAGCGAGQITQTSSQSSGVGGASANIGQIAVREAAFPFTGNGKTAAIYPSGGTAPLTMTVVNFGGQDDKLTGVSSPVAASVNISGDATIASGRLLLVGGEPAGAPAQAAGSATPRPSGARATPAPGSAQATPAPGGVTATQAPSATAAPNAAAPSTAGPEDTVAAGPTGAAGAAAPSSSPVAAGTTTAQVVLTGLKQDLQVGPTYPVVLTFQRAGEVTVQVPVANPAENQGPTGE